ncbi:hypothetical protein CWI37_1762p0020 [Hamiltosporidium tvaerminnensis]|uniref:Uncharacterized protein n=1 Tax=Hamiltosporidium tvaerminnensis TaxID=1176355 RepID=A0A4Q9KU81_9MICR|nr:hypothetical protein CWI37_1762p0020 [Hamiltosporidium tvaerminnensis]
MNKYDIYEDKYDDEDNNSIRYKNLNCNNKNVKFKNINDYEEDSKDIFDENYKNNYQEINYQNKNVKDERKKYVQSLINERLFESKKLPYNYIRKAFFSIISYEFKEIFSCSNISQILVEIYVLFDNCSLNSKEIFFYLKL